MKRRHFLEALGVGGLGISLARGETGRRDASPVRTPLVLMAPRADGIDAVWGVTRLSRGWLEWETETGLRGKAGADPFGFVPQGDSVLRVRLSGLPAGSTCRVRSVTVAADGGDPVTSPWKTFRALDPHAPETRFVMWNDTHVHDDTLRALHAATPSADFLMWNGDTCNDWTRDELLIPTLLHPGECDVTDGRPMFIAWGNHDVRGAFAYRMPDLVPTPNGRPFHAFRSGPVAVICLHTGEDKPDDHPSFRGRVAFDALRAEQAAWLAEVIRRPEMREAPYRLVFCHIPLRWTDESPQDYSGTGFDRHSGRSRDAWHEALVAWKTQVVLSGHTHRPAWIPPTAGFPYGQLVGGGPRMEGATWLDGAADPDGLRLRMLRLDGSIVHDVRLEPVTRA
jgi:hypothetical protein